MSTTTNTPSLVIEFYSKNTLVQSSTWDGPAYHWEEAADVTAARNQFLAGVLEQAAAMGAVAKERVNPNWAEAVQHVFPCHEVSEDEIAVTSTVGTFRLQARRARRGEPRTAVSVGPNIVGSGSTTTEDQMSLPVELHGRLNPPKQPGRPWTFQPSIFRYEDGTNSDFLGLYPIEIRTWEGSEPAWFADE